MDEFSCRGGLRDFWGFISLFSIFLGVNLVYFGIHGCQVKDTSDLCFDESIEFETSSIIDLHVWFVCTGFQTKSKNPFDD